MTSPAGTFASPTDRGRSRATESLGGGLGHFIGGVRSRAGVVDGLGLNHSKVPTPSEVLQHLRRDGLG